MAASLSVRLFAQGGVYSLMQFVNQATMLVLLPIFGRYLDQDQFGVIALMGVTGTFLGYLVIQGLQGAWSRLRFDEPGPAEVRRFEATIVWYLLICVSVFLVLLWVCGPALMGIFIPSIPFYPLGALTAIYAGCTVFVTLLERKYQAEQRPIPFAIFSGARSLLMMGTIIVFLVVFGWGAEGKIFADALTAALLGVVALVLIRPASPRTFSRTRLQRSLAYGLPLVPHQLAGLANDMIDRLLVNGMLGLAATGTYAMGYRVGSVGLIVATALNQAFVPLFVTALKDVERQHADGDHESASRALDAVAQAGLLTVTCTACICLAATAIAREALMIIAPAYDRSWEVVAIVAAATVLWACYFPFAQSIAYEPRHVRWLAVVTISAAAVNLIGNLLLIPALRLYGAAIATLVSCAVLAGLAYRLGQASTPIPYRGRRWLRVLTICFLALAGLWWMDNAIGTLVVRLVCKLLLGGVAALACARLAGVHWADVRRLGRGRGV